MASLGPTLVRVNNVPYSWTSSSFLADNFPLNGLTKVAYEQKLEQEDVYANRKSGLPIGYTAGKYSVDGFSLSFLKEDTMAFLSYLATKSGVGAYGKAEWTFTAQCAEFYVPASPAITIVGYTCRVVGKKDSYDEGSGKLMDELTVKCLQIIENGITMYDETRDGIGPGY